MTKEQDLLKPTQEDQKPIESVGEKTELQKEAPDEEIMAQAENETLGFRKTGEDGLAGYEKMAEEEGLVFDGEDRKQIEALSQEAELAKNELRNFSKRYSPEKRSEKALEIWRIRKEYRERKKQIEQQNNEMQERKRKLDEEIKVAKIKVEKMEKSVARIEEIVREQKNKLWYKFSSLFREKKLANENVLKIAQKNLNQYEDELQEKLKMRAEAKEVILESSDIADVKNELSNFYAEQSEIKSKFEEEREQRDLNRISKEKGVMFIHGLPMDSFEMSNTSENNSIIDTKEADVQAKIQMILGLEPTLSTSTVNEKAQYNKGMMYPFGVILKGGNILSAYRGDAGTEATGLYTRKSKYDKSLGGTTIQGDISKKIEEAIENPMEPGVITNEVFGYGFNEIVVENPRVSALYVNLENPNKTVDISKIKIISEQLGLLVVGLKGGKLFDLVRGGKELSLDACLELGKDLSSEERLAMAENSIETFFSAGKRRVPAEAKHKLEELKKKSFSSSEIIETSNSESKEFNLLDARGIETRGKIANWVEKIFSSSEYQDGNGLVEVANKELRGDAPVQIKELFNNKTKEECLEIVGKLKEEKERLDIFFDGKVRNIIF